MTVFREHLSLVVAIVLLASVVLHRIWLWYHLAHIPGPRLASFSKFWLVWRSSNGSLHIDLKDACKKYGSLVRIGPRDVITDDFEVIRRINGSHSEYFRSDWYLCARLDPPKDNIVSERNEARHSEKRAKMAAGYAGKDNPHLESSINSRVMDLVNLFESKYISTDVDYKPVDFSRLAQYFTMDVIGDIALGTPFGFLRYDKDMYQYIERTEKAVPLITTVGNLPFLSRLLGLPVLRSCFLPTRKDEAWLGKIMGIAHQKVAERYETDAKDQEDMLGSFVRHGLTRTEAESESLFQIIAGSDTAAAAIRATMLFIITSRATYDTLLAEVEQGEREGRISWPVIRDAEARELPYLQACIKEGLRMQPPVTGLSLKEVPAGGDVIHGLPIPGGTRVGLAQWAMQRKTDVFGADAEVFRPERWLAGNADVERHRIMDRSAELIFSSGRYGCLGRSIAQMELSKVFVELLRRFEFSIVDPTRPWDCTNAIVWLIKDMNVRVTRRNK